MQSDLPSRAHHLQEERGIKIIGVQALDLPPSVTQHLRVCFLQTRLFTLQLCFKVAPVLLLRKLTSVNSIYYLNIFTYVESFILAQEGKELGNEALDPNQ